MDVINTLKQVAKENNVNISNDKFGTNLKELGIDSLKLMNLVFKVEAKLNVRIPDEELIKIKTINDLIENLNKLI